MPPRSLGFWNETMGKSARLVVLAFQSLSSTSTLTGVLTLVLTKSWLARVGTGVR